MNKEDLLEMKDDMDKAKADIQSLTGQKKVLLKQLLEKTGCKNMKAVHKKLKTKRDKLAELETDIEERLEKIEDKYFPE